MVSLPIKKVRSGAQLPALQTSGSAGYDLFACLTEPLSIEPDQTELIPTGIAIGLPDGNYAAFIYARSSLGIRHGVVPANCVGVIDSDYRGEILVGLYNYSADPYTISPGDRIAQMVISPILTPVLLEQKELERTERGAGGFGSTGKGER